MVARVAQVLLEALRNSTKNAAYLPPGKLVTAGALLHDIAKTQCLDSSCDHARLGRDICLELGYPEVAEVVREHVILTDFSPERYSKGSFLAKELVYYADKRVRHDEVVILAERLDYILEQYGNNDPIRHRFIKENFAQCKQLEHFLFSSAQMDINSLQEVVASSDL